MFTRSKTQLTYLLPKHKQAQLNIIDILLNMSNGKPTAKNRLQIIQQLIICFLMTQQQNSLHFVQNCTLLIFNMNPCFDASQIQSKDKGVYISLKNSINRGQLNNLSYHCSLVDKRGRTFSFVSHTRILVLISWKDKLPSIGYIQIMRKLPPWTHLPERKFQKELNLIKNMVFKDKCLQINFYDEAQSWELEFQHKNMTKSWFNLIQTHKKVQKYIQNIEKSKNDSEKFSEKKITFQLKFQQQNNSSPNFTLEQQQTNQLTIQTDKEDHKNLKSYNTEQSSMKQTNSQLLRMFKLQKQERQLKEKQLKLTIQMLRRQNSELRFQNQKLKAINKQIKDESARLRIGKSVLSMLKQQYQKKHLQQAQLLTKKSFQINKLLEKCADIILMNKNLEKQLNLFKKRHKSFKQTGKQLFIQYDFQLSSSSNDNTKQLVQQEPDASNKLQRYNTLNLQVINQDVIQYADQKQLTRQNTIY